jgi:pimeloyl-ACP methyl ester carboxylesterase
MARGTGSGRHDSLDACLAWSHALLSADAAAIFRRLSVFPAGFDLAAAKEVAGTPPVGAGQVGSLVGQLVTASLLEADTSGTRTRFRFLEPVRQYAAARLADAPSFDVADLLLSLHPMAQLQNDDDAVKVTISLIEGAEPWANPGRLGQYQADLAWLEDSSNLDRLDRIKPPCLAMAFEHVCWFPPHVVREAAERIPSCQYTELPGLGHGAPLLAAGQVNSILVAFLD